MLSDAIGRTIYQTIHHRNASIASTAGFSTKQHNADLCRRLTDRLDSILAACKRNFNVAYDCQGLHDDGVDVVVRLSEGDENQFIAFQVKADDEFDAPGMAKTLKSQYFDAQRRYSGELHHYYIVPCLDLTKSKRVNQLREIAASFANVANVTVIHPQKSWQFLYEESHTDEQALVTAYITDQDPLVIEASAIAKDLTMVQLRTLLVVLAQHISEPDRPLTLNQLKGMHYISQGISTAQLLTSFGLPLDMTIPPEFTFEVAETDAPSAGDLDHLSEFIEVDEAERVIFNSQGETVLLALAYEGHARYGLEGQDLTQYLESLLLVTYEPRELTLLEFEAMLDLADEIASQANGSPDEVLTRFLESNWSEPASFIAQLTSAIEDNAELEDWELEEETNDQAPSETHQTHVDLLSEITEINNHLDPKDADLSWSGAIEVLYQLI